MIALTRPGSFAASRRNASGASSSVNSSVIRAPNVDLLLLDELDRAWIDMAHATRELHRQAAPAGLRCRKRVEIAVRDADEHDPAADPSGANRIPEAIGRIRGLDDERGTEPFRPLDQLVQMGRHRCRP